MQQTRSFLVIAEDPDRLLLVSNTLHRRFPNSAVQTCRDSEPALRVAQSQKFDAIVTHRATDLDEIPLIEHLRQVTAVPIIALAGHHGDRLALAAGASRNLHPDQWLLVATVVAEAIGARAE